MSDWSLQKARELYNTPHWSSGYFDINNQGHLIARPNRDASSPGADVHEIAQQLYQSGGGRAGHDALADPLDQTLAEPFRVHGGHQLAPEAGR